MSERPTYTLKGDTGDWELVMGLEVHAQVASEAKLFSGASTAFGADPNCNVSLVDAAMPGMLPVINKKCVEQAVRTGLGLKAKINKWSRFDRKNYFYPDLPQGYQISQFDHPIVGEGEIEVDVEPAHGDPAYSFPVRIERLHLEQDAGKSIHDMDPTATYVDLNRSGVALMEIVSKPDVRTPLEAAAYVKKLKSIVVALGTCDGDMEKGNLRADVNVSVCKPGAYEKFRETGDFSHLGTRCEIKNMNSFRFIQAAIEYEARRQIEILESGGKVDQETRLFDPNKGETRSMRSKEDAHDYRYFPDPDLLPLEFDDLFIENIKASLPELPDDRKLRYKDKLLIDNKEYLNPLVSDAEFGNIFEDQFTLLFASRGFDDPRQLAAILAYLQISGVEASRVFSEVGEQSVSDFLMENPKFDPESFAGAYSADAESIAGLLCVRVRGAATKAEEDPISLAGRLKVWELAQLLREEVITSRIANEVFERMIDGEGNPGDIVEKHGLKQVTDTGAIEAIVDQIIAENPEQAAAVKEKPKSMGWFVGQVMKASGGKANPQAVNEILKQKLGL